MAGPPKIFVSYSHKDKKWLERLQVHFKALERDGSVDLWDDTEIKLGARWDQEIEKALDEAKVAILLASANFMASSYIVKEQRKLLEANKREDLLILVVVLRPCLLGELEQFQTVNDPEEPLEGMTTVEQERVLVKLVKTIKKQLVYQPEKKPSEARPQARLDQAAAPSVKLLIRHDDDPADQPPEARLFRQERITIGRDRACDLCLRDDKHLISKQHAEIVWADDRLYLTDIDSMNHTYLNDAVIKPFQRYEMQTGATMGIGAFKIAIETLDAVKAVDHAAEMGEHPADMTRISSSFENPYEADVEQLVDVLRRIGERYAGETSRRNKRALYDALHAALEGEAENKAYLFIAHMLLQREQKPDPNA